MTIYFPSIKSFKKISQGIIVKIAYLKMLRKALTSLSLLSIAAFTPLNAEEKGTYFVGSIGAGQMADIDIAASLGGGDFEFDSGFSGEIGIGYDFGKLRTEFT